MNLFNNKKSHGYFLSNNIDITLKQKVFNELITFIPLGSIKGINVTEDGKGILIENEGIYDISYVLNIINKEKIEIPVSVTLIKNLELMADTKSVGIVPSKLKNKDGFLNIIGGSIEKISNSSELNINISINKDFNKNNVIKIADAKLKIIQIY